MNLNISATRERDPGEITPVSAVQSSTSESYVASLAIDLNWETLSWTALEFSSSWLKLNLGKGHCVQEVLMYYKPIFGGLMQNRRWTCTQHDCSKCVGSVCNSFILTVSMVGAGPTSAPVFDCKYGDTVKLQIAAPGLYVNEMVVIGKQGKSEVYQCLHSQNTNYRQNFSYIRRSLRKCPETDTST